jgi:hypothetical protein
MYPDILLQCLELSIKSGFLRALGDPLLELLQLSLLANLITNLHVLALRVEAELTTNALLWCALKSTVRRSCSRSVGIGCNFHGSDGCWCRRRCGSVPNISLRIFILADAPKKYYKDTCLDGSELRLHRFVTILLRLRSGRRIVQQERVRSHFQSSTLLSGLYWLLLILARLSQTLWF